MKRKGNGLGETKFGWNGDLSLGLSFLRTGSAMLDQLDVGGVRPAALNRQKSLRGLADGLRITQLVRVGVT